MQTVPGIPDLWNFDENVPQSMQLLPGGENGSSYLLLDQDFTGENFNNPVPMIGQQMATFPVDVLPLEVVLSGWLAIPGGSPIGLHQMGAVLKLRNNSQEVDIPIQIDPGPIPLDGTFHPFTTLVPLPPDPFSGQPVLWADLILVKSGPGQICFDGLQLGLPPVLTFQPSPDTGSELGGTEVELSGTAAQPGARVFFGDRGALVVSEEEGLMTVIAPPAHGGGMADISIIPPGGGSPTVLPGGFSYLERLRALTADPRVVAPELSPLIEIRGHGFLPGFDILLNGVSSPIPPGYLDTNTLELDTTGLTPGEFDIEVVNPDGKSSKVPSGIRIVDTPVIDRIVPARGHVNGGTLVDIYGWDLDIGDVSGTVNGRSFYVIDRSRPDLITVRTPPNPVGDYPFELRFDGSVNVSAPEPFSYVDRLSGDLNGDTEITVDDVIEGLLITSRNPTGSIGLEADANGDGRVGLEDAHRAFIEAGRTSPFSNRLAFQPIIEVSDGLPVSQPVWLTVRNLGDNAPATLHWGDGFFNTVTDNGIYEHTYLEPGTYSVRLDSEAGSGTPKDAVVLPNNPVSIRSIDLILTGIDINDDPITTRSVQLNPENDPPTLSANIRAVGSGTVHGRLILDSSEEDADLVIPFSLDIPEEPLGEKTVPLDLGAFPRAQGESHIGSIRVDHGADIDNPESAVPLPVSVQVPNYVTSGDCEELERQWKALVAQKEAKKAECEALKQQLENLKKERDKKEKDKPNKEQDLQDLKDSRDSKQSMLDNFVDNMNAFLGNNATVQTYMDKGDFPEGKQFAGARRNGSSSGIGMSFDNGSAALDGISNYETQTGRDFGADLAEMRQLIKVIEELDKQIADKEQELQDLCDDIDDLNNNKIPDKEQEITDCMAACDALEQQIADLVDAHKECLEQLENQRQAAEGIADAERQGGTVQEESDSVGSNADETEEFIGGRAGSPEEIENDESEVATGKACQQDAQDLIDEGNALLAQAKAANAQGDTETANDLRAQAQAKFAAADLKLDEAQDHIDTAQSNAEQRKERDCPVECEGQLMITEQTFKVFSEVVDVSMVPLGRTPDQWGSFFAAVREAIEGLALVNDLIDEAGDYAPISTAVTPDVERAATAIVNAYFNLAGNLGLDVWVKHRGRCVKKTVTKQCINGCWTLISTTTEILEDEVEESIKIGEIPVATPKDQRQGIVETLLENYYQTSKIKPKTPPSTRKE